MAWSRYNICMYCNKGYCARVVPRRTLVGILDPSEVVPTCLYIWALRLSDVTLYMFAAITGPAWIRRGRSRMVPRVQYREALMYASIMLNHSSIKIG